MNIKHTLLLIKSSKKLVQKSFFFELEFLHTQEFHT